MGAKAARALRAQGLLWGALATHGQGPAGKGYRRRGQLGGGTRCAPGRGRALDVGVSGSRFCASHDLFFMNRNMFILSNTILSPILVNL